jgi:hypothetical protein
MESLDDSDESDEGEETIEYIDGVGKSKKVTNYCCPISHLF